MKLPKNKIFLKKNKARDMMFPDFRLITRYGIQRVWYGHQNRHLD